MSSNRASVRQYLYEGKWHWEVISASGRLIGRSLRGYTRKVNCSNNMHRVANAMTPPMQWLSGSRTNEPKTDIRKTQDRAQADASASVADAGSDSPSVLRD